MTTPVRPLKVGPFNLGMNNRLPDTELSIPKVGTFLRSAVNVDVTTPGTVKRREGFAQLLAGTDCHSLWGNSKGDTYYVDGSVLYRLQGTTTALAKTAVLTGLAQGVRLSFTEDNGITYMTNGVVLGTLIGSVFTALPAPTQTDPSYSHLVAMPAGNIVRTYDGRVLVASGAFLFYSEAFSYMHDGGRGFIPFASPITVLETLPNGFYVATATESYYFGGDIMDATAKVVLPYGAVAGTSGVYPEKNSCYWMSKRGLVQATAEGEVKNVQENNIAMNAAALGAAMYREQDGRKQVVTSLFGSDMSGASAYSFMDAEIIRKATTL